MRTNAIAQQDLEQAESNRTQAKADLNAAEQGMRILGIKNPADLAKAPLQRKFRCWRDCRRGGGAAGSPGQVVQAGQTQAFTISDLTRCGCWPTSTRRI